MNSRHPDEFKAAIDEAVRRGMEPLRRGMPSDAPTAAGDAARALLRDTPTAELAAAVADAVPGAVLASRRRVLAVRCILSALIEEGRNLDLPEDTAAVLYLAMETLDQALVPERIGN